MRMKLSVFNPAFAATFAVLTLTLNFCTASDWPQWRGPNRDGVSTEKGLLKEWPEGGPKLLWKTNGIGDGYSGVAVVGDRIYTSGDTESYSSVFCLDAKDGKQVWAAKLGKPGAPGWGGFAGPRATPSVADGKVYTVDQWGEFLCVDAKSGKEVWRKNFTSDFGGKRPEWGFSESPLVDGDKVVVTPGGSKGAMVALNKNTGALIWASEGFTDEAHYSSVVIGNMGGKRQYVQLTAAHVVGIDPEKGGVLWMADRPGKTAVIPTPICDGDFVYVTSGYGVGCNLFKISAAGGKLQAEQVYANKVMADQHGGVVKIGDYIYGHCDGQGWVCQDFKTGESKWVEKSKVGKGSILGIGNQLIVRQEDKGGTIALIDASPEGWREHGKFEQPDRSKKNSWPHPVVANGVLYIRDQGLLLAYDLKAK